jgi:uncharacterized protein YqjF (DUF2071 family)
MSLEKNGSAISYRSSRLWPSPTPARCEARVTFGEELGSAQPGTLEDFLCERYLLYSEKSSRLFSGQVVHTPYPLRRATLDHLDENLVGAAGIATKGSPTSVLASPGVDVDVYAIEQVP